MIQWSSTSVYLHRQPVDAKEIRNEVKFAFIKTEAAHYPVRLLCKVMRVSKSAFYAWQVRPATLITAVDLHLYRRAKKLFQASRASLGSRELTKKLRKEGIKISRDARAD